MRQLILAVFFLPAFSCLGNSPPKEPTGEVGVSIPFECSYAGFVVLRGWLVVPPEKVDEMEELGINIYDYWLECESAIYNRLKCSASERA